MLYGGRQGVICNDLQGANRMQINANQRTEKLRNKCLQIKWFEMICNRFARCISAQITAGASGTSGASGVSGQTAFRWQAVRVLGFRWCGLFGFRWYRVSVGVGFVGFRCGGLFGIPLVWAVWGPVRFGFRWC